MRTSQFVPMVLLIFGFSASAVYASLQLPESPVHEQRKTLLDKHKKVYGPKSAKSTDAASADQKTADGKDQVKDKDKAVNQDATAQEVQKQLYMNQYNAAAKARTGNKAVPPPSKNLLNMKKAHEQAAKKKPAPPSVPPPAPPSAPDVVGTLFPPVQN